MLCWLCSVCIMSYSVTLFTLVICLGYSYGQEVPVFYLGCYRINPSHHHMPRYVTPFSAERCFKVCASLNKSYAGLESIGKLCHCHDKLGSFHLKKEDSSQCSPCQDDSARMCGGDAGTVVSIYKLTATTRGVGVDILLVNQNRVELFNTSRSDKTVLAATSGDYPLAVDYHYERDEAYALWDQSIYRFPLGVNRTVTSIVTPEVIYNYIGCRTFTVDWVHNHIIRPVCGPFVNIQITDLDGSNQHNLIVLPKEHPRVILDIVVDPYKGLIFWLTRNSLRGCELDGRNLRTLVQPLPAQEVLSLTLDMVTEKIYFAGTVDGSPSILYTTYDGSECQTLRGSPDYGERILSIGVFRCQVFFVSSVPNTGNHLVQTSLFGNDTSVTELTVNQANMSFFKLVYQELQSPSGVYACTHRECSHHCVVEASLARCLCPRGLTIGADGKTCEDISESRHLVSMIIGGLVCVVLVVLVAGVMMCICDKLWSHVHPKSVRIILKDAFKRPVTNNVQQDGNHLI